MENHHVRETFVGPPTFLLGPAVALQFFHSGIATVCQFVHHHVTNCSST